MASWALAPFRWLRMKLGLPSQAEIWKLGTDWDLAQCNDLEVWESDPFNDRMRDAFPLRRNDPEAGFLKLLELAELGSVWSMVHVAACYDAGRGVAADAAQAEEWYGRAFASGCDFALLNYAKHLISRGDRDAAEAAYRVGVARDWAPALFWLAQSRTKRSKSRKTVLEVRPLIERAAALGSPNAKRVLSRNLAQGRYGLREIPRGLSLVWELASEYGETWQNSAARKGRDNHGDGPRGQPA